MPVGVHATSQGDGRWVAKMIVLIFPSIFVFFSNACVFSSNLPQIFSNVSYPTRFGAHYLLRTHVRSFGLYERSYQPANSSPPCPTPLPTLPTLPRPPPRPLCPLPHRPCLSAIPPGPPIQNVVKQCMHGGIPKDRPCMCASIASLKEFLISRCRCSAPRHRTPQ